MLKNISKLQVQIEDKTFEFHTEFDASLDLCKQAILRFLTYIGNIEEKAKEAQAQKMEQEQKVEAFVPEENEEVKVNV